MATGRVPAVGTPTSPSVANATAARQRAPPVSPLPPLHLLLRSGFACRLGVGLPRGGRQTKTTRERVRCRMPLATRPRSDAVTSLLSGATRTHTHASIPHHTGLYTACTQALRQACGMSLTRRRMTSRHEQAQEAVAVEAEAAEVAARVSSLAHKHRRDMIPQRPPLQNLRSKGRSLPYATCAARVALWISPSRGSRPQTRQDSSF